MQILLTSLARADILGALAIRTKFHSPIAD